MEAMRAVLVCALLCSAVAAEFAGDRLDGSQTDGKGIAYNDPSGRVSHRVQLLFPLLLRISSRLATLVSTAMMSLVGISLFVAFSKKALIVSLLALFLTYLDKRRPSSRDEDVVHIHRIRDLHRLAHDAEHFHHRRTHPHLRRHSGSFEKHFYTFSRFPIETLPSRTRHRMRSLHKDQSSFSGSWATGFESSLGDCNQAVPIDRIETEV